MNAALLFVDGQEETPAEFQFSMPRIVYSFTVPGEAGVRRVLGRWGFSVTVIGPSERLLGMHAAGTGHAVELRSEGLELGPVLVIFDQLFESIAGPVLFGHLPHGDDPPQWQEA